MQRLFIGIYPGGISYADRQREERGDYALVGFLPFDTLVFKPQPNALPALVIEARKHAAAIEAKRGEDFPIDSCGHTVRLGHFTRNHPSTIVQAEAVEVPYDPRPNFAKDRANPRWHEKP